MTHKQSVFKAGENVVLRCIDGQTVYVGESVECSAHYFELANAALVSYEGLLAFLNNAEITAIHPIGSVRVGHMSIKEVFEWKHHLPSTAIKSLKKVSKKK